MMFVAFAGHGKEGKPYMEGFKPDTTLSVVLHLRHMAAQLAWSLKPLPSPLIEPFPPRLLPFSPEAFWRELPHQTPSLEGQPSYYRHKASLWASNPRALSVLEEAFERYTLSLGNHYPQVKGNLRAYLEGIRREFRDYRGVCWGALCVREITEKEVPMALGELGHTEGKGYLLKAYGHTVFLSHILGLKAYNVLGETWYLAWSDRDVALITPSHVWMWGGWDIKGAELKGFSPFGGAPDLLRVDVEMGNEGMVRSHHILLSREEVANR